MTTISVIGYGSEVSTDVGRVAIVVLLLISLGIVPQNAGEIVKLFT